MRSLRVLIAVCAFGLVAVGAYAVEPAEMLPDPVLEQRARDISAHLRCVVCQNQTIDDSDAPLAHDMRLLVRERILAGDSDKEVRDYIVARYGNFVLLQPPFQANTWALWIAPFLVLALAGLGLGAQLRRRAEPAPALTDAQREKLATLLDERPGGER